MTLTSQGSRREKYGSKYQRQRKLWVGTKWEGQPGGWLPARVPLVAWIPPTATPRTVEEGLGPPPQHTPPAAVGAGPQGRGYVELRGGAG